MREIDKLCDQVMSRMLRLFISETEKVDAWRSHLHQYNEGVRFRGDCDDFMVTASDVLIYEGVHPSRLMAATCEVRPGERHVVLIVDDRLVLDNLQTRVVGLTELSYTWLKSMSGAEPGVWRDFSPNIEG